MAGPELPEEVRQLIRTSVPTLDSLELLVFLARGADRPLTAPEIVDGLRPTEIAEAAVAETLALLVSRGLLVEGEGQRFAFRPASPGLESAVRGLVKAYDERPVTLIRQVYTIAASQKIRSFADAFRLKKD
jgi:hypothetical protein